MNSTPCVRQLNRAEQGLLLEWAGREGWNPGRHDAELFWALDPDGYLGLEIAGQLVGGGAIIRHNQRFGFMGLFIVRPEFRTRKLGTQLWYARRDRLLERLELGATIGLDAVDAMVPFYARGGFQAQGRHCRFEWRSPHVPEVVNPDILPLEVLPFEQVVAFDAACFPGPREAFLSQWISQPEGCALALVRNDQLLGFGVMRPCLVGWKIGPLFAAKPEQIRSTWMLPRINRPPWSSASRWGCRKSLAASECIWALHQYWQRIGFSRLPRSRSAS